MIGTGIFELKVMDAQKLHGKGSVGEVAVKCFQKYDI